MKFIVLAVRDSKADVYGMPYCVINRGSGIRSFGDEVARAHTEDRPNMLNLHSDDFELFELGAYEDETAQFELLERPKSLAVASDYKS